MVRCLLIRSAGLTDKNWFGINVIQLAVLAGWALILCKPGIIQGRMLTAHCLGHRGYHMMLGSLPCLK